MLDVVIGQAIEIYIIKIGRLVAGARNRLCSSPEIAEIDYSLYAGGWHVAPQFNLCELGTAA